MNLDNLVSEKELYLLTSAQVLAFVMTGTVILNWSSDWKDGEMGWDSEESDGPKDPLWPELKWDSKIKNIYIYIYSRNKKVSEATALKKLS